jgi:hypothetical protein
MSRFLIVNYGRPLPANRFSGIDNVLKANGMEFSIFDT